MKHFPWPSGLNERVRVAWLEEQKLRRRLEAEREAAADPAGFWRRLRAILCLTSGGR